MTREKLFAAIRNNPKAVRFEDACKAAEWMNFTHRSVGGSHVVYAKTGEPRVLNFQNREGYIYPYRNYSGSASITLLSELE